MEQQISFNYADPVMYVDYIVYFMTIVSLSRIMFKALTETAVLQLHFRLANIIVN